MQPQPRSFLLPSLQALLFALPLAFAAAALSPEVLPPIEAKELELIMTDLGAATGEARQPLLKELEAKTRELLRTHPDFINLWAMRATAVYELNDADAAKAAGANLLRLGADRDGDDRMISLLAMLKRKGWLMTQDEYATDKVTVAKQAREAREKQQDEEAARKKAAAAKLAKLRQEYQNCLDQVNAWDAVTARNRRADNYDNYSVDKSYEWGMKAGQILGEIEKVKKGK